MRNPPIPGAPHMMPSPPTVPWNAEAMPWTITPYKGVMEFNASHMSPFGKKPINLQKRKSLDLPPLPTKQFITEEKMAAHLNGLHISSDYISHSSNADGEMDSTVLDYAMDADGADSDYTIPMSSKDLAEKLKTANRISVCEQIRKLTEEDTIIPKALLSRVEKPCTALVLWQPPLKLCDLTERRQPQDTDDLDDDDGEETNKDNNNSSSFDFNYTMDTDM